MSIRSTRLGIAIAGLAAAVVLGGCATAPSGSTTGTSTPSATSSTQGSSTPTSSSPSVSANTASQADIAAALQAAGVSNADRWAREVVEYRPYDTSDTNLAKLRQNLAKYNPGEDTINKIVSVLQP
jgi:hypothetical protein